MLRIVLVASVLLCAGLLSGQTIALPDSADVVRNKVKTVRIYFKSEDGKRYQQKEATYNAEGRIIMERENENTFYYVYSYDQKGRKISSTQRSKDGALIQKFTETYDETRQLRTVSLFSSQDTAKPSHVYVYDQQGRKVREEQYSPLGVAFIYSTTYNKQGDVISNYDSVANLRMARTRADGKLLLQRTYDPGNHLLHQYRYIYNKQDRITDLFDSTGLIPVVHYKFVYNKSGVCDSVLRDNVAMPPQEYSLFQKEFFYLFPHEVGSGDFDNALPSPELVNEHHFTRDKKGNIIRDDLVQRMGSASYSYVYEYEYEFY